MNIDNEQIALNNSVPTEVPQTRIAITNQNFIVLNPKEHRVYHGHKLTWDELTDDMHRVCIQSGLTNVKGKIKIQ